FVNIIKIAQKDDVYVLLTCFFLTVIIDMQIAVAVGIGLASVLFIKRTIDLYSIELVSNQSREYQDNLENILIYDINGPMFFGAAQKALKTLLNINEKTNIVILNMKNVSMLDVTAMVALKSIVNSFETEQKKLIFCGLNQNIQNKLQRAKFDYVTTFSNLEDAIKYSKQLGKIKP
ncbi:STAS domain-containing protein, partial [Aliarcobacter butzleri]